MFELTRIPSPDPMPLPGPLWLLRFLLLLTFILHITAMNLSLGGVIITALCYFRGRHDSASFHQVLSRGLSAIIPYAIAATITLGIAPLLFIQVLYGQFIYTSSILIGVFWLSVIALLMIGYYSFYYFNFRVREWQRVSLWVIAISAICFILIAFIYTANMTLMLTPEKWSKMYFSSPYGINLNLSEPTLIPRFLHFFLASLAVGGILITYYGLYKSAKDAKVGKWAVSYGVKWFTIATVLQIVDGIWFLFALPESIRSKFLGGDIAATAHLATGFAFALTAIAFFHAGRAFLPAYPESKKTRFAITLGSIFIFLTIVIMSVMRDMVRGAYLQPHFASAGLPQGLASLPVEPQWGVFLVFAIFLVLAIATLGWMIIKVLKSAT